METLRTNLEIFNQFITLFFSWPAHKKTKNMSVLTSPLLKPDFHYDHLDHCDRPLQNLFPITGIIVMISGIAFNRPDHLSRLRAFPYDRFKIYTIVLIVHIEIISIQVIKVVSVVRVVCDHLGSVCMAVPINWTLLEMTGTIRRIRTIIWKPGFKLTSLDWKLELLPQC